MANVISINRVALSFMKKFIVKVVMFEALFLLRNDLNAVHTGIHNNTHEGFVIPLARGPAN